MISSPMLGRVYFKIFFNLKTFLKGVPSTAPIISQKKEFFKLKKKKKEEECKLGLKNTILAKGWTKSLTIYCRLGWCADSMSFKSRHSEFLKSCQVPGSYSRNIAKGKDGPVTTLSSKVESLSPDLPGSRWWAWFLLSVCTDWHLSILLFEWE